ncbi:glycosyltransferase family 4 protein [Paenibacillus thailandensis]|uniref:Glycosyltransferase family 4 protein n=1 Tax=Paenibacillus thailandensis TaxID=393250 RepID=A0ABW5QWW8_9BACL
MDVLLEGLFYNGYGFAEDNRFLLQALDSAGYRVRILPRDPGAKYSALHLDEIRYIESFEHTELHNNDIYICNIMGSNLTRRPDFRVNIARTGFETDRIPSFWIPNLNAFDEVWVFSQFNQATFSASGVTSPIKVIPSYSAWAEADMEDSLFRVPFDDKFLFLSVFDWSDRKGYDLLINAYLEEFARTDNVALIIKTTAGNDDKINEVSLLASGNKEAPEIFIMNKMLPTNDLIKLYRLCNAFVLPTRGEGWGRPIMEAMIVGMPVIATNWSGPTDFMNEDNAFPVKVDKLTEIRNHPIPLFNGHRWAEPSLNDLKRQMRYVYENPNEAKQKGIQARSDILGRYGKTQMIKLIKSEIEKFT